MEFDEILRGHGQRVPILSLIHILTENKLLTLEDLQERLSSVNEEFEALSDSVKKKSARPAYSRQQYSA